MELWLICRYVQSVAEMNNERLFLHKDSMMWNDYVYDKKENIIRTDKKAIQVILM